MAPKVFGSRIASVAFGILAMVMIGVTVLMTGAYSASQALSDFDRFIQAASAISSDLMGFAIAFAVAMCFKYQRRAMGIFLLFPLLAYAGYSTRSVIGFNLNTRVAKDVHVTALADAEKRAVQEANAMAMQMRQENLEWLRSTAYQRAQRKDRQSLMAEIRSETNRPIEVKVSQSEGIMGDPAAEQIAGLLGWVSPRGVQISDAIWLAVLVVMGKILGSFLCGYLWVPRREGEIIQVAATTVTPQPYTSPARPPRPAYRAPISILEEDIDEQEEAAVAALKPDVEQVASWRNQTERFFAEATFYDPDNALRLSSTDVYHHYLEWARAAEVPSELVMSHNRFGRQCRARHVQRDASDTKRVWFDGLVLIPVEAREVPHRVAA
jgi:hypothetical protein